MPAACRSSSVPAAVLWLQGPASRFWCSPIKRRCRSTRQNSKPHFSSSRPAGRSFHKGNTRQHHLSSKPLSGSRAPLEPLLLRMHMPQSSSTSMSPNFSWQDSLQLQGETETQLRCLQAAELSALRQHPALPIPSSQAMEQPMLPMDTWFS